MIEGTLKMFLFHHRSSLLAGRKTRSQNSCRTSLWIQLSRRLLREGCQSQKQIASSQNRLQRRCSMGKMTEKACFNVMLDVVLDIQAAAAVQILKCGLAQNGSNKSELS